MLRSPYDREILALAAARARRAGRRAALRARRHRDRRPPRDDAARRAGDRGDGARARRSRSSTSSPTGRPRRSRGCTAPGRDDEAAALGAQALWLALAIGARARCVLVAALAAPARRADGRRRARSATGASLYLRIAALGAPFFMLASAGQGYLRGIGDLRTPLVILVAAHSVNVVLELLFVYGFDWGLAGSAWGTVIAQAGMGARVRAGPARAPGWERAAPGADPAADADRRRDRRAHDRAARLVPGRLGGAGAGRRGVAGRAPDRVPAVRLPRARARRAGDRRAGDGRADARRRRRRAARARRRGG